jgi:SAM-dependent methyltransferase
MNKHKKKIKEFLKELLVDGVSQSENSYVLEHFGRYQKTIEYTKDYIEERDIKVLDIATNKVFCFLLYKQFDGKFFGTSAKSPKFPTDRKEQIHEVPVKIEHRNDKFTYMVVKGINLEIDDLPYYDETFDLVFCNDVIEHLICSPTKMLCEIFRTLKPNGYLCLTTDNVNNLLKVIRILLNRQTSFPLWKSGVYHRHNREYLKVELEDLLAGIGFRIVKSIYFNYNPFSFERKLIYRLGYELLYSFSYLPLLRSRKKHILVLCQRGESLNWYYPNWLYK